MPEAGIKKLLSNAANIENDIVEVIALRKFYNIKTALVKFRRIAHIRAVPIEWMKRMYPSKIMDYYEKCILWVDQ